MADAKREHEYNVAISTIDFLGQSFSGTWNPSTSNPWREQFEKTEKQKKEEAREAWDMLRAGMRRIAQR